MKKEISFLSSNGENTIYSTVWEPETKPRAILLISHGMQEYIERYADFAEFLNENGILVAGNDHLGHGRSVENQDEWGYFRNCKGLSVLCEDVYALNLIIKDEYPDIPCFLLGHSMGSFVARRYMINHSESIDGCIVMGTGHKSTVMLKPGIVLTKLVKKLKGERDRNEFIKGVAFAGYNSGIEEDGSDGNWLTHDVSVVDKYNSTPECTFSFTLNGYENLFECIDYIKKSQNVARIRKDLPILVISGEQDPVGGYGKEVKAAFLQLKKAGINDCKIKLVKNARHEVLNEIGHEKTYKLLLKWLELHYCK